MLLEAVVDNQKDTRVTIVPCFQLLIAASHEDGSFPLDDILVAIGDDVDGVFVSSFDEVLFESSEVFVEGLVEGMEQEDVLFLGVGGCVVEKGCDLVQELVLFLVGIGLDGVGRGQLHLQSLKKLSFGLHLVEKSVDLGILQLRAVYNYIPSFFPSSYIFVEREIVLRRFKSKQVNDEETILLDLQPINVLGMNINNLNPLLLQAILNKEGGINFLSVLKHLAISFHFIF